jgi:hypothetical protein
LDDFQKPRTPFPRSFEMGNSPPAPRLRGFEWGDDPSAECPESGVPALCPEGFEDGDNLSALRQRLSEKGVDPSAAVNREGPPRVPDISERPQWRSNVTYAGRLATVIKERIIEFERGTFSISAAIQSAIRDSQSAIPTRFPGRRTAQSNSGPFLCCTNEQPFPFCSSIVTADATLNS